MSRRNARAQAAFSLIELVVAIAVLVVGIFGTIGAIAMSQQARMTSAESERVAEFLKVKLQEYRAHDLTDVVTQATAEGSYTAIPAAYGLGSVDGEFRVEVLAEDEMPAVYACDTDQDGDVDASDTWDLDGDGLPNEDTTDSARADYASSSMQLVPIRITVRWSPHADRAQRTRTLVGHTILYPTSTN